MRLPIYFLAALVLTGGFVRPQEAQPPGTRPPDTIPPTRQPPALLRAKPLEPAPGDDELQRLLKDRYNTAVKELGMRYSQYEAGQGTLDSLAEASRRVLDSELALADDPAKEVAVREQFLEYAREFERTQQARSNAGVVSPADFQQARYLRLDAEIHLLEARRKVRNPSPG